MSKREDRARAEKYWPDVKVKIRDGCALDGRTDQHTHTQTAWRALIDQPDAKDDQR